MAELGDLSGVYYEPAHAFGPMLHFVYRARVPSGAAPVVNSPEISEAVFWAVHALPTPMTDFTERCVRDAAAGTPARVWRVGRRRWRR